ncbi:MAG: (d)CMP kinase [Clostridiales bacterium]|nr:(d)CMP kinase [Clostridiales bacterium]
MLTIAVDGYSSSGKGAVCTRLARRLGIIHFETGAIYRLLGVYVKENNIDPNDKDAVVSALKDIKVSLEHDNGKQITILNGENITDKLHTSEISDICSILSPYPECRDFVTNIQRSMAKEYSLIMEGRDITSHVLPDADFKFFLDAELDVRAKRRYDEFVANGEDVTFEQVKEDLRERDKRDTERELCPLILREGTIHIDNSYMTLEDEVELMYKIIKGEVK